MIEKNTGEFDYNMDDIRDTGEFDYNMDDIRDTGEFDYNMDGIRDTGEFDYNMDDIRNTGELGYDMQGARTMRSSYNTGSLHTGPKRPGYAGILKYVVSAVIIAYIVVLMIFTSGSTKSFTQVEKAVEASLDTSNLKQVDVQGLKRYYGLNSADYEGVMLYSSQVSMSTEEVLLIKVKNEKQVQQVKDAVQKRLDNRKKDFDGYAPEQVKLIEQAQLSVRGKFIFLAVAPKAEAYKDAFANSL